MVVESENLTVLASAQILKLNRLIPFLHGRKNDFGVTVPL